MRSRKIVRGWKEGLTKEGRYAVADHAVAQLKERGDPWRLNEEVKPASPPDNIAAVPSGSTCFLLRFVPHKWHGIDFPQKMGTN